MPTTSLNRTQAILFSQLTGIPLGAFSSTPAQFAATAASQRATLTAALSDRRLYVRQRAQQGLDALDAARDPGQLAAWLNAHPLQPINYRAGAVTGAASVQQATAPAATTAPPPAPTTPEANKLIEQAQPQASPIEGRHVAGIAVATAVAGGLAWAFWPKRRRR